MEQQDTAAQLTARMASRDVATSALLIALLVVSCLFTIPLGPVPFTLQTAVVILVALLCTPRQATLVIGVYLLMGAVGLPVFSSMTGGLGKLLGPTGGFLFGFFASAPIAAMLRAGITRRTNRSILGDIAAAACIIVVSDALGLAWFMFVTQSDAANALLMTTLPFIVPDVCKAALAIIVAAAVRKGLRL